MRDIVILGASGHGVSVANVVASLPYRLVGFVDPGCAGTRVLGLDVVAGEDDFIGRDVDFALGIGNNARRGEVAQALVARVGAARLPALVHASASVGIDATLGAGTVVMPNATVGPCAELGAFCLINTNASLDHHGVMGEAASLAPGAHAGGNVTIGAGSAISLGAVLRDGVTVGAGCVIGAASYVHEDIPDGAVAWGTPAKVMRGA